MQCSVAWQRIECCVILDLGSYIPSLILHIFDSLYSVYILFKCWIFVLILETVLCVVSYVHPRFCIFLWLLEEDAIRFLRCFRCWSSFCLLHCIVCWLLKLMLKCHIFLFQIWNLWSRVYGKVSFKGNNNKYFFNTRQNLDFYLSRYLHLRSGTWFRATTSDGVFYFSFIFFGM